MSVLITLPVLIVRSARRFTMAMLAMVARVKSARVTVMQLSAIQEQVRIVGCMFEETFS